MLQICCGLLLDPGLGKTAIALAAIKILRKLGYIKRVLVIAPKNVMLTAWPGELNKWADFHSLSYTILHGKDKERALQDPTDIHIINPEGLSWFEERKDRLPYDMLVVDESTKFKNTQTQRFKILRKLAPTFARRYILTGTFIPNGLEDLFGQVWIIDQGNALGRYITHFRNQFFFSEGYGGYTYTPRPGAFEEISARIKPMVLRMAAEDYLTMPKLMKIQVPVALPSAAMKQYKAMESDFFLALEQGDVVAGNKAVAGGKCRQIANGAVYDSERNWTEIHDAKLDALEDLLEQIGNQPVLIIYEFQHDRDRIRQRLGDIPSITGMSAAKISETVTGFNSGLILRLLGHPASMGHGLNMQGRCCHVIWFGIQWDLDYEIQANARVYRQGQESDTVFIYYLVAQNTLDERVFSVLAQKHSNQEALNHTLEPTK